MEAPSKCPHHREQLTLPPGTGTAGTVASALSARLPGHLHSEAAVIEQALTALGYLLEINTSWHGPGEPLLVFMAVAITALL